VNEARRVRVAGEHGVRIVSLPERPELATGAPARLVLTIDEAYDSIVAARASASRQG
jgi:hypothetical protein